MGLTLRPTGVESPVDKNRQDFTIFSGKWEMGRIYEERSGPVNLRWFWSLHGIVGKPLASHRRPRTDARRGQGTVRGGLAAMARLGGPARGRVRPAVTTG
jgi:hypothetical protein